MNAILKHALALAGLLIATQAAAQITFYEHPNFGGRTFTAGLEADAAGAVCAADDCVDDGCVDEAAGVCATAHPVINRAPKTRVHMGCSPHWNDFEI